MSGSEGCSCDFKPPRYGHSRARGLSGYAVYLDFIEDETEFDLACPFHGENGSMVAVVSPSGRSDG